MDVLKDRIYGISYLLFQLSLLTFHCVQYKLSHMLGGDLRLV